jgi:hypothetical protein
VEQTDSYWPGLFHCYSSPCIPATNNDTEQFILLVKNLERRLANNPQPAVRFVRHAPVSALFIGRDEFPGADFIARCAVDGLPAAKALLALRRKKTGAMRRARKDFVGETDRLLERWKEASTGPPDVTIIAPSRSQAA